MLTSEDLPEHWRIVAAPVDDATAAALERIGCTAEDPAEVSWDQIEDVRTGRRLLLRMTPDTSGLPVISGMYVIPGGPASVSIVEVRNLPLAAVEAASRARKAGSAAWIRAALQAGPDADNAPLGRPTGPDDREFYARLALRYIAAASTSQRPAIDIAEREGVSPRTVQRWLSSARGHGFLAPGRPGRVS